MIVKTMRGIPILYNGKLLDGTNLYGKSELNEADRETLIKIRATIMNRAFSGQGAKYYDMAFEVDLGYMTPEELKAICDEKFVVGVDFKTIDTTPPFTSKHMNDKYPGSVDAPYWKRVFANSSLYWNRFKETIETSIGLQTVTSEIYRNTGIEDTMSANTMSQGINLQNILLSEKALSTRYRFRYNPVNDPIEYTYLED